MTQKSIDERLATIEAQLRAIKERIEAENTATMHPDPGHSVHDRLRGEGHS